MTVQEWITNDKVIRHSRKAYAHFDYRTDISVKRAYITDSHNVAHHGFYPFIHYEMVMYRYRKGRRTKKTRDICYAAHIDRCIFQYYGFILNELYNKRIRIDGIENVAVAYRTDLHQTNIEFSKRAFDYINALKSAYVMIGDFTHFFDNLDHQYLKRQWCSLLGDEQLPEDHYNVFKHVTAYSKWELKDLLLINGLEDTRAGRRALNRKSRVLTKEEYRKYRSHISKHIEPYGIPQGSPISSVLANVYMLEVDKRINNLVTSHSGMYMRYSDDFIIVLPEAEESEIKSIFDEVQRLINDAPRLLLEPNKTQYFRVSEHTVKNCGKTFHDEADESKKDFIDFLGFRFNGKEVRIRPKTITKYYYRMYRKAKTVAKVGGYTPDGKHISCKELYSLYSERGARGRNFLSYVYKADGIYDHREPITRDTKRHMQKIRKALNSKVETQPE